MSSTAPSTRSAPSGPRPARARGVRASSAPGKHTPAQTCVGLITQHTADGWLVQSGQLQARGKRATSCLIEPAVGDSVACLLVAPDEVWVLAVLQREPGTEVDLLCSERPLRIEAPRLDLHAPELSLEAEHARVSVDSADVVGRQVRMVVATVKLIGTWFSSVFDRVTSFSKHHLRTTEGTDRVQAQHIEQQAEQMLRVSAEHALINGEKLVKTQGGQIHFG